MLGCFLACKKNCSRRVLGKFIQESILIAFDFIWKELLSNRNLATLLDPPLKKDFCCFSQDMESS